MVTVNRHHLSSSRNWMSYNEQRYVSPPHPPSEAHFLPKLSKQWKMNFLTWKEDRQKYGHLWLDVKRFKQMVSEKIGPLLWKFLKEMIMGQARLVLGALSCIPRQREENSGWEILSEYEVWYEIRTVIILLLLKWQGTPVYFSPWITLPFICNRDWELPIMQWVPLD